MPFSRYGPEAYSHAFNALCARVAATELRNGGYL